MNFIEVICKYLKLVKILFIKITRTHIKKKIFMYKHRHDNSTLVYIYIYIQNNVCFFYNRKI